MILSHGLLVSQNGAQQADSSYIVLRPRLIRNADSLVNMVADDAAISTFDIDLAFQTREEDTLCMV